MAILRTNKTKTLRLDCLKYNSFCSHFFSRRFVFLSLSPCALTPYIRLPTILHQKPPRNHLNDDVISALFLRHHPHQPNMILITMTLFRDVTHLVVRYDCDVTSSLDCFVSVCSFYSSSYSLSSLLFFLFAQIPTGWLVMISLIYSHPQSTMSSSDCDVIRRQIL